MGFVKNVKSLYYESQSTGEVVQMKDMDLVINGRKRKPKKPKRCKKDGRLEDGKI